MAEKVLVATRKGLLTFARRKGAKRHRLARTDFLGDPVTMVLSDARDGALYAALNLGHFGPKLWRSRDNGKSWHEIAMPAFPPAREGETGPAVFQVWSLETGGDAEAGTLWAGTIPGGLFRSRDGGDSWQLVESLWNRPERAEWGGGGYDQPGIHSICVDPRDARHVLIAVSVGGVWETRDAGEIWTPRAAGMRAAYMPPERAFEQNVQDPHRMAMCRSAPEHLWVQHHNGIFHSTDGAESWREIENVAPSAFGFAVAVHPADPATAWFVPGVKDERRVPVDGRLCVTRTRDGGQSFEILGKGLPAHDCFDLVYRHGLDVDATGSRLVMGSTTGNLWCSDDGGEAWTALSHHLPPIYAVRFSGGS